MAQSKTLLNGVNEILKRVQIIAGDSGALTSLTDSARQHHVDVAVQVTNEAILKLYTDYGIALPDSQASSTITLASGTRDYSLASDLVQLRPVIVGADKKALAIDRTNSQYIWEMPGGYDALLAIDLEQDDTGLPQWGAIDPTDGTFYLDRAPTSVEAGRVYTYQYDKSLLITTAAATYPFNDDVFTAMVPAWVQLWKRESRNEFDGSLFSEAMADAARMLSKKLPRTSWSPRR